MYVYVFNNNVRVDLLEEVRVKKNHSGAYMHVYVHACMRVYMRAHTSTHTFASQYCLPNNMQVRAQNETNRIARYPVAWP